MSEQTPPLQGDTVRVVLEARVNNVTDKTIVVETDRNYMPLPLADISVEVLERADDPSRDPIGTVRRSPDGVVAAKSPNPDYPWRGFGEPCGENFATVSVVGWPVIGSVPGTPAAEADPVHMLIQMGKAMRQIGETDEAYIARLKREGLWQEPAVSGPAEAEKPRDLCQLDECVAAPRCSSGATVWHDKTAECGLQPRELRVFRSDGPDTRGDAEDNTLWDDTIRVSVCATPELVQGVPSVRITDDTGNGAVFTADAFESVVPGGLKAVDIARCMASGLPREEVV